ncbi:MAG: hypothetical protein KJ069_01685 [Anaerolineae bacterium]|nr:hypothetical protein [Anaerolineae bacterium]
MRSWFLVLAISVLVLAGCQPQEEVVMVTPRVVPTATPLPTQSKFLENHFKLSTPDSQMLIQLRTSPYQMPVSFMSALNIILSVPPESPADNTIQITQRQQFDDYFLSYIEMDLERYYPEGIAGASVYLFPRQSIKPSAYLFGRGIIDFLNAYGHPLDVTKAQTLKIVIDPYWYKGTIILESVPMQLDSDSNSELLLYARTEPYGSGESAFIPINITTQNRLEIIPNDFGFVHELGCWQANAAHDLNRDKQNDILLRCDLAKPGFSMSQQIVFTWSDVGIFRIGETDSVLWRGAQFPYEIEIADIDSDGFEEIVWFTPCQGNASGQCEVVNAFSWSEETYNKELMPMVVLSDCTQISVQPEAHDRVNNCVLQLSNAVLAQTDPTIPTQITDLLHYLPTDDPEARPYREHLTYLLGYNYELSGDEDTAVSTYLSLIQQSPTSPWAWLAWARLEPVEE